MSQHPKHVDTICTEVSNISEVVGLTSNEIGKKARILVQRERVEEAVDILINQGIKTNPEYQGLYIDLAEILISEDRYEDALQVLTEMPRGTDNTVMCEIEAICQAALGHDEAAWKSAEKIQHSSRAHDVLGTLTARKGDMTGAETHFRKAVDLDPTYCGAWLSLGMLLWSQGESDDAWQAVHRSMTENPLNSRAINIYEEMSGQTERTAEALILLGDARKEYPDSRRLALHHFSMLVKCRMFSEALEVCESFLLNFGIDDSLLKIALEIRKQIGVFNRLAAEESRSVTLSMIVKNEERNLARCLSSVKPIVHELVIVDTGSSDRTTEIATVFGATVSNFSWNGSFSDARNFSLSQARGRYILVMDADEVVSALDHGLFRQTVCNHGASNVCWSVMTRNYTHLHPYGWIANNGNYPLEEKAEGWHPSHKIRLIPNDQTLRFSGRVHELIEPAANSGYQVHTADFIIHHYGGLTQVTTEKQSKNVIYYTLGKLKLSESPDDLPTIGEIAVQASELGLYEEAVAHWNHYLELRPGAVIANFNKGFALMRLERFSEALESTRRVLELDPFHKEAAFNYGICALYTGEPQTAIKRIEPIILKLLDHPPLLAVLTVLHLAIRDRHNADLFLHRLQRINYSIADFISERVVVLRRIGLNEYADAIEQSRNHDRINP